MAERLWRRQDDHRASRPADPPLRDHRDRQRKLALQTPRLTRKAPPQRFPSCRRAHGPQEQALRAAADKAAVLDLVTFASRLTRRTPPSPIHAVTNFGP